MDYNLLSSYFVLQDGKEARENVSATGIATVGVLSKGHAVFTYTYDQRHLANSMKGNLIPK